MQMTFAAFDMDVPEDAAKELLVLDPSYLRGETKKSMLYLFATIRHYHPGCRTVLLTDEMTQFGELPHWLEVVRFRLDAAKLTMSCTKAHWEFIKQTKGESHIVFLDTDILIQGNLDHLFIKDFDVGLTYRYHFMPYNGGVIFVNGRGYKGACVFFEQAYALIRDVYVEYQARAGSQLAFKVAVGLPTSLTNEQVIVINQWGVKVLLVPASTYNYTKLPPEVMDEYYPDKLILHFKGDRKGLLFDYFDNYLKNEIH